MRETPWQCGSTGRRDQEDGQEASQGEIQGATREHFGGGIETMTMMVVHGARKRRASWWSALFQLLEAEQEAQREEGGDEMRTEGQRERFEEDHSRRLYALSTHFQHLRDECDEYDDERCRLKRARFSACSIGAAIGTQQSVQRRLWVKNRSQAWYIF